MNFPTFMVKMAVSEQKKRFMDESGPFDQQRDSVMPHCRTPDASSQTAGAQNRRDSSNRQRGPQFIGRFRFSTEGPTNRSKAPLDRRKASLRDGAPGTKRKSFDLRCEVAVSNFLGIHTRPPARN